MNWIVLHTAYFMVSRDVCSIRATMFKNVSYVIRSIGSGGHSNARVIRCEFYSSFIKVFIFPTSMIICLQYLRCVFNETLVIIIVVRFLNFLLVVENKFFNWFWIYCDNRWDSFSIFFFRQRRGFYLRIFISRLQQLDKKNLLPKRFVTNKNCEQFIKKNS